MKLENKDIENWIKPLATVIGGVNDVDESLRTKNHKYAFQIFSYPISLTHMTLHFIPFG